MIKKFISCSPLVWVRFKTAVGELELVQRVEEWRNGEERREERRGGWRGEEKNTHTHACTRTRTHTHTHTYTPEEKGLGVIRERLWDVWMLLEHAHLKDGCFWSTKLEGEEKMGEEEEGGEEGRRKEGRKEGGRRKERRGEEVYYSCQPSVKYTLTS